MIFLRSKPNESRRMWTIKFVVDTVILYGLVIASAFIGAYYATPITDFLFG